MAKILVVEDNPISLKLATLLLETAGHEVLAAVNAEIGITTARQQLPQLILMDVQLSGMSGLEATALLKRDATTSAIPVIALTALTRKQDEDQIFAAGCDGYIAKPIRYQAFLAQVAAMLAPANKAVSVGRFAKLQAPSPNVQL